MGGNPGAIGNGLTQPHLPPTEYVENVRAVEQAFVFSQIKGKRTWEEILIEAFRDEYADPSDLEMVVRKCSERIAEHFIPIKLMDLFREAKSFNAYAACK